MFPIIRKGGRSSENGQSTSLQPSGNQRIVVQVTVKPLHAYIQTVHGLVVADFICQDRTLYNYRVII